MRISNVQAYAVLLKVRPALVISSSAGTHAVSRYALVCIQTDEGLTGWGEATVMPGWSGETQAGAISLINDYFTPLLRGRDPSDVEAIMKDLDRTAFENNFTKAAVEMALLDLLGKKIGIPVYQLLGGEANPQQIPIKFSIGAREPEEAAELARDRVQQGFKALKIKVGPNLEKDLLRVRLVREAVGSQVRLNVDVNGGWGVKEAIRYIPLFAKFDLEYVEQPVPRWDIDGMAEVRKAVDLPIMADESLFSVAQALEIIRKNAADILSIYPGKNGGILKAQLICKMAEAAGMACHIGSNLEWDIGTSAMCHLAVANSNIRVREYPVDIIGPLYYDAHLRGNPIRFEGGTVFLPRGPGLGIIVDEAELQKLMSP